MNKTITYFQWLKKNFQWLKKNLNFRKWDDGIKGILIMSSSIPFSLVFIFIARILNISTICASISLIMICLFLFSYGLYVVERQLE